MATAHDLGITWTRDEFIEEFSAIHFETFQKVVHQLNLDKIKIACMSAPAVLFRNYMFIDVPWGREYCALDMTAHIEDCEIKGNGRFRARIEKITFFNDHGSYLLDKIEKEGDETIINEN